jgi:hypothetical protein
VGEVEADPHRTRTAVEAGEEEPHQPVEEVRRGYLMEAVVEQLHVVTVAAEEVQEPHFLDQVLLEAERAELH